MVSVWLLTRKHIDKVYDFCKFNANYVEIVLVLINSQTDILILFNFIYSYILWFLYQKQRKAPWFIYGDISYNTWKIIGNCIK